MKVPVEHALMSVAIHTVILVFLLRVAKIGIFGVVMADMCFSFSMCVLNGISLSKLLHHRQEYRRTFLMPLCCALIMGAVTLAVKKGMMAAVGSRSLCILTAIPFAVAVYAFLLIRSGTITEEELKHFPKGNSLIRAARRFRILR